ncbi:hypothetical protein [Haloarchaeobius sp. DT45]|uniref:hypothetical protein n=1 Tax=Haloarchaeobius sp. DT45 TaxID=3446116 RepID=UPI003F6CBB6C
MTRLRRVSLVLALAAAVALTSGTTGFSAVEADRSVQVSVVGDDEALVGYATPESLAVEDGDRVTLLEVENRLGAPLHHVAVEVATGGGVTVAVDSRPGAVGVGQVRRVTAEVTCEEAASATVVVDVEVESHDLAAAIEGDEAERSFTVDCEPGDSAQGRDIDDGEDGEGGSNGGANETDVHDPDRP